MIKLNTIAKAMMIILIITLLFSCTDNSKVKIFVSWPGGEGMPNYEWKKGEDRPTGIEPSFIERVLEVAELEYEYVTDFEFSGEGDPRIEVLKKEEADICIRAMTITDERKKHVLFSNPYYIDGLTALVRKKDSIYTLSDLNGKRVYTLEFTSAHEWVDKNLSKRTTHMSYEKFDTAFIKPEGLLLNNEIDAYVLDKSFLNEIAKNNQDLEILNPTFTDEIIGIAISKKNPHLVSEINQAMEKMKTTGEFYDLLIDL